MRYGIFVNPKAGDTTVNEKRAMLEDICAVFDDDCAVYGLDTESPEEFRSLVAEKADEIDILIAAGGDGSVSDVVNAVDNEEALLSFLPLGSACALRDALNLPDDPIDVARQIARGRQHKLDLILCDDDRKAFVCAVGVEGKILKRREELQEDGQQGFTAYLAAFASVFGDMDRTEMTVSLDGETLDLPDVATAIVTKIPYYGYRMEAVPEAVFDDGNLHLRVFNENWASIVANVAKAWLGSGASQSHRQAREIHIQTDKPRFLHIDGNVAREGDSFRFRVLPGALRMWY